jgi:hypothetical protein
MQKQRPPKQIATARMEGIRKRRRPCKGWKGEVEENLNIMEIQNRQTMGSASFLDFTQRRMLVSYQLSGQPIDPIFKGSSR